MSNPDHDNSRNDLLTNREAFLVMADFIWEFAQRAGDDLLTLIGDTSIEADGAPSDPAAWDDWLASVKRVKLGASPRTSKTANPQG